MDLKQALEEAQEAWSLHIRNPDVAKAIHFLDLNGESFLYLKHSWILRKLEKMANDAEDSKMKCHDCRWPINRCSCHDPQRKRAPASSKIVE